MGMAASDVVVKFGVLHLLGVCMMLYPLLKKLPTTALSVLAAAIVAIGYAIQGMRFSVRWLFPLGFVYPGFTSSDFFRSCRSSAGSCSASSSAGRSIMKSGRFCPARHRIFPFPFLSVVRAAVSLDLSAAPARRLRSHRAGRDAAKAINNAANGAVSLRDSPILIQNTRTRNCVTSTTAMSAMG